MWRKLIRWLLALSAAGAAIVLTLAITLYLVTDTQKVLRLLEQTVYSETGGKLTIASLDFDAFRGFTGKKIRFEPPNIDGTPRTTPAMEFIDIDEVRLHYNLWSVLYGTFEITRAQAKGGMVAVKVDSTTSQFQGISAFRLKAGKTKPEDPLQDRTQDQSPPVGLLIAKFSKLFWIPVRIKVSKIGLERISFNFIDPRQKTIFQDVTALIDTTAYWRHLDIKAIVKAEKLQLGGAEASSIDATLAARLVANQQTRGFDLRGVRVTILNQLLASESSLVIYPTPGDDASLNYQGKHDTKLKLKLPPSFMHLIPVAFSSAGDVSLSIPKLSGKIKPIEIAQKVSAGKFNEVLPDELTLIAKGENIEASLPSIGISLKNTQFNYTLEESRTTDNNIKISSRLSHLSDSINLNFKKDDQSNRAFVNQISFGLDTMIHFPRPSTITNKMNLSIGGLGVEGESFEKTSVPITLEVDGDSADGLGSVLVHQRLKIGELLTQELIAKCSNRCRSFQLTNDASIPSFERMWAFLKPNASRMIIPKFVPEQLNGSFALKFETSGNIASDLLENPRKAIEGLKIAHNTSASIDDLTIAIPANRTEIRGASFKLAVSGTEKLLTTRIDHQMNELSTLIENKSKKTQEIKINGIAFASTIASSAKFTRGAKQLLESSKVTFQNSFGLGRVYIPSALAKPLTNIKLTAEGDAHQLRHINLKSLALSVPDLTTNLESNAKITLNEDRMPESFILNTKASINGTPKDLIKGFDASGNITTEIAISSRDMDNLTVQGMLEILDLSANYQSTQNANISAAIQNITGTFPIYQKLSLHSLRDLAKTQSKHQKVVTSTADEEERADIEQIDDESILKSATQYLAKTKPAVSGDTRMALNQDYANFRELYERRRPIRISTVKAMGLSIENIEIDAELSQNQFAINNAVASFLGGKLHADFKMSFDDRPSAIKAAFHATRINTEKLVKSVPGLRKKAKTILTSSNPLIDGAVHLNYDLRTGDMQGGLNITSIGKDQLRMILYYIDPGDRDATITAIKTALNFGDVKLVSVPIKNGEIGLDVSLRLFAAPIPTPKLQGFPIAKLINNFREQGEGSDDAAH